MHGNHTVMRERDQRKESWKNLGEEASIAFRGIVAGAIRGDQQDPHMHGQDEIRVVAICSTSWRLPAIAGCFERAEKASAAIANRRQPGGRHFEVACSCLRGWRREESAVLFPDKFTLEIWHSSISINSSPQRRESFSPKGNQTINY